MISGSGTIDAGQVVEVLDIKVLKNTPFETLVEEKFLNCIKIKQVDNKKSDDKI